MNEIAELLLGRL